jgi:YfiH family protein
MFYQEPRQVYRVPELDSFPWLIHGFGTRHCDIPAWFANLATLQQIHSATCVAAEGRCGILGQGDALLEDRPGAVIAIKTADCIPILLVDERHRALAAVHAGWRGTVERIAAGAVEAMRRRYGSDPRDLHAAIGPGIGPCCYQVGPEVAARFGREGRAHIDLPAANAGQLRQAGVTPERIYASNLCTMCHPGEFHSFRRDGQQAGRLYSFAGIAALQ